MDNKYEDVKRTLTDFLSHNDMDKLLHEICYECDITEDESIEDYYAQKANDAFPWWAAGMTKFVFSIPYIDDYVFKIPLLTRFWYKGTENESREPQKDYCKLEAKNYCLAKSNGVESFFAETVYLDSFGDVPVYASYDVSKEALDIDSDKVWKKSSDKSKKWTSRHNDRQGNYGFIDGGYEPIAWLADKVDLLKVINLLDFMRDYKIADIHSGNFVYTDSGVLILDYSGFGRTYNGNSN